LRFGLRIKFEARLTTKIEAAKAETLQWVVGSMFAMNALIAWTLVLFL